MFKNVAAKFIVFAFDVTTGAAKTGDAANITAYVSKDYGAVTVLADTGATELEATNAPGYYLFDAAQGETNADCLMVSAKSATANISVIGAPAIIYTRPTTGWLAPTTAGRTLVVDAAGLADANTVKLGPTGSGTAQTARDLGLAIPAAVAGAAGGLQIAGSNAATTYATFTVTGATTLTGNVVLSDGLTVSAPSTSGRAGIDVTGNGAGAALKLAAGATGKGIAITTTAGDGLSILPTAGSAIVATGNGTSKHGIIATGGTAGTSDGATFVAGSGGVDFRANQTGSLTGNISGSVGSVTGLTASNLDATISSRMATYTQPTGFLAATFPAGTVANTTNITAGTMTTTTNLTTNNDKTGYRLDATGSAALTEGYAALGAAGTLPQILYEIRSLIAEKTIVTTTLTTKKLDGVTTAGTYTLDSATAPTSITRAS